MALLSLGLAGMSAPPLPPQRTAAAGPDLTEYGASGTPIFGGFLRERGEYNPQLIGLQAVQTYEQMRRSDAQVAATLAAIKMPIRSAEWTITAPEDASPVEKEAADFVRECLFEDLDFSAVLRNALLMLDFGCAVHEDVYEMVGNRVRLAKLAPRLPLTFYRWITDENGEDLIALEQMGYRGNEYVITQLPVDKMSLFTYNQEGQNYTGLSLLRAMYQHWYMKSQLYKVDAIASERNGMGIPVITMGPDTKAEDRATAKAWVSSIVAHEHTGVALPPGWTFKLEGVTGTVFSCKDSIQHHNEMISMAGLAMFMMLGQSQHGNRALGASMSDFFFMSLEATSHQIARVLSLTTVKRLVDFNFAGVQNYPRVSPQQILTLKFETVVSALKDLAGAGVIEPDDNLEGWMREKLGAPEIDKKSARPGKSPVPAPGQKQQEDDTAEGGDAGVDATAGEKPPTAQQIAEATDVLKQAMSERMDAGSVHVDGAMSSGLKLRREPRGAEKSLALADIVSALDKGRDDVAFALRSARSRIQAEIVNKLVGTPVRNMHRVSIAPDAKLVAEIEQILSGVSDFGAAQVGAELARQKAGQAAPDAAQVRAVLADKRDPIGLYADGVVSEFTNNLTARATNETLDWSRKTNLTKGEVINGVSAALDDQSDKWIDGVASKGANEAFADGREDGYEQHKDEIASVIYSALLDVNTCEACSQADGQEGTTPDDIPDAPNPDCDGGDKCRCVHVFVFGDEAR